MYLYLIHWQCSLCNCYLSIKKRAGERDHESDTVPLLSVRVLRDGMQHREEIVKYTQKYVQIPGLVSIHLNPIDYVLSEHKKLGNACVTVHWIGAFGL